MPCPLLKFARLVCEENDGDWGASRRRCEQVELCHVDGDCVGLVDIFDRMAPSYGAQSVEQQAERLVATYGERAQFMAAKFNILAAPFPRVGLSAAVAARLTSIKGMKAVRR